MKLNEGLQNFWFQIGINLAVAIAAILLILWYYSEKAEQTSILMGIGLVLTLSGVTLLAFLKEVKSQILRSLPDQFEYEDVSVDRFPSLDFGWVKDQSEQLEQLGFVPLKDYTTGAYPAIARLFTHPQYGCLAEAGQMYRTTGEVMATNVVIYSTLTEGWGVVHVNRQPQSGDGLPYIWRHPQVVRIYQEPVRLPHLLDTHLDLRATMVADLGVSVRFPCSWAEIEALEQKDVVFRKQALRQKPLLLAMLEATWYELHPTGQWLGDYPKVAAKRRSQLKSVAS